MKNISLIYYSIINIVFIDALINYVYKSGDITTMTNYIDMFKCFCYLGIIIYSYKLKWFLGILVGFICLIVGLYTTYKYYKIQQQIFTPI